MNDLSNTISQPESSSILNRKRQMGLQRGTSRAPSTEAFPARPSNQNGPTSMHNKRSDPYPKVSVQRRSQPSRSAQRAGSSTTSPPQSSSSSSSRPHFPPRRPIQRSIFANPDPKPVSVSDRPRPSISPLPTIPTTNEDHPRISINASPPHHHQQLSSPLKSLFDYTMLNLYSGLAHLNSTWISALYKERHEKESMKAQYLKMQQERDAAVERSRDLENLQSAEYYVVEIGGKRAREEVEEEEEEGVEEGVHGEMQLPTPPTSCSSQTSSTFLSSSSSLDEYALAYPSPTPPPPSISGRQMFFPRSSPTLGSPSHPTISLEDTSLPPPPASAPAIMSRYSSERPRSVSPSTSSTHSSSSKRRRLSSNSHRATEEEEEDVPTRESEPTRRHREDKDEECDMEFSSDGESSNGENNNDSSTLEWSKSPRASVGASGKKFLFTDSEECIAIATSSPDLVPKKIQTQTPRLDVPPTFEIPRLNILDLNRMYFRHSSSYYCRACCLSNPGSQWRSFPPDLDILMCHCTSEHPVAYAQIAGLTLQQVSQLQELLKANGGSSSNGIGV